MLTCYVEDLVGFWSEQVELQRKITEETKKDMKEECEENESLCGSCVETTLDR